VGETTISKIQKLRVVAKLTWIAYKPKVIERLGRAPWERRVRP
jgi:hypothetical protein